MSGREQNDEPYMRDQTISSNSTASYPSGPHSDPLQPQDLPDSLTTLTQYLSHLTQECDAIERGKNYTSQTAGSSGVSAQVHATETLPVGLPTPASMAEVLMSTRHLLMRKIEECLLQVARYMENQANITDLAERMDIQAYAFRSGRLVQNLGAFLLELGRPMMTLQMGSTPADAMVNTGPALFVSVTGPNNMTVQPQPFPPGTSHGAIPMGTSGQSSGFAGRSVGTGFIPRNSDMRIPAETTSNDSTVDGDNAPLGSAGVPASSEQGNSYSHHCLPPSPKRKKRE